jgi:hypothetical protein
MHLHLWVGLGAYLILDSKILAETAIVTRTSSPLLPDAEIESIDRIGVK